MQLLLQAIFHLAWLAAAVVAAVRLFGKRNLELVVLKLTLDVGGVLSSDERPSSATFIRDLFGQRGELKRRVVFRLSDFLLDGAATGCKVLLNACEVHSVLIAELTNRVGQIDRVLVLPGDDVVELHALCGSRLTDVVQPGLVFRHRLGSRSREISAESVAAAPATKVSSAERNQQKQNPESAIAAAKTAARVFFETV